MRGRLHTVPPLTAYQVGPAVHMALKDGYRHIDAAHVYGNEHEVGKALHKSVVARDDVWVTGKLWNSDHRPSNVHKAIKKTLKDLQVKKLDLYLMHWPVAFHHRSSRVDSSVSILETWRAMEELVHANLTRYIGVSNFSPKDLDTIFAECEVCPFAHEFEAHPYLQQQEFVNWHHERDVKVIAYSPLANTNPHYHSVHSPILDDPFWVDLAKAKNATVAQTILAWGRQRDTIVIPKSVHKHHIEENLGSLDVELTKDEMQAVSGQDKKYRMNDPGRAWGVPLFDGLDDATRLDDDDGNEL
jgi:alcohol dehydrogenase (NADP+)